MKKSLLLLFSFFASIILPVKAFAAVTEISSASDLTDAVVEVSSSLTVTDSTDTIVLGNNGTVKLLTDIKLNKALEITGTVKLDLNGHTITVLKTGARSLYAIDNYGTLTLEDGGSNGSIQARGITNNSGATMTMKSGKVIAVDENGGAAIWNEGSLTMNGGTLEVTHVGSPSDTYGAGCLNNQGTAVINNGTFTSVNRRTYAIISTGDITIKNATVTGAHGGLAIDGGTAKVSGGTFTSTEYYGLYVSNDGTGTDPQQAAVEVTGGTFEGPNYSVWVGSDVNNPVNSTIVIKGGTFKKKLKVQSNVSAAGGITVMGGTFEDMTDGERTAESSFVPEGYTQTTLENGTFRVLKVRKVHVVHESTSGNNDRGYNVRIFDETITDLVEGDSYSTDALTSGELSALNFTGYYYLNEVYGPANGTVPAGTSDLYVYYRYSNKYKVTYRETDESVITTENVYYNNQAALADGPAKTGYVFGGWYDNNSLTGSAVTSLTVTDNVSLYAKYIANQHNLMFVEEATVVTSKTQTIDYNSEIGTYLYTPTKKGYTFVGWFKDSGLTQQLDFTTMPDEDVTLYAKWRINQYTVNFNDSDLSSQTVDYLTVIDLETPTRTGYTFEGWYRYSIKPSNKINGNTLTVKENTELYANWTINNYTLTFETNGGEAIDSVTQEYNTSYNIENVIPVREGYQFDGWYSEPSFENGINGVTFTQDKTVYAKWLYKAKLNVWYVDKDMTIIHATTEINGLEGQGYEATPIVVEGYVYSATRTAALESNDLTGTFGTTDVDVYLVYDQLFTLTFETNGGSAITTETDILDGTTIDLSNYSTTRENYQFAGWYTDAELTQSVTNIMIDGYKTVYAKWLYKANLTINYVDKNNNPIATSETSQHLEGQDYEVTPIDINNYSFSQDKTTDSLTGTFGTTDVVVTLVYDRLYTLTFNTNGGEAMNSVSYIEGTEVQLTTPVREGYRFAGWYRRNPRHIITSVTMDADTTVNATWVQQGTVTVRHIDEDGTEIAPTETLVGDINTRYSTSRANVEGYYLVSSSRNTSGRFGRNAITVTYTYSNKYTVTFENTDLDDLVVAYNTEVTLDELTKDNYVFDGWYSDPNFNNALGNTITVTEDVTVYAKWLYQTKLIINYVDKDGNDINEQDVTIHLEGMTYDITPIEIEGYVFSATRTTDSLVGTYGATDVIVNLVYDRLYSVSFNTNGGSAVATIENVVDETVIDLANYTSTKDYYNFDGWYTDEALTSKVEVLIVDGNITLFAKWNPVEFNITYDLDGGSVNGTNPETYTIEDDFDLINPTKEGHTFAGWKDANGVVKPFVHVSRGTVNDLSYTATWTVNQYTLTYGNTLKLNEKFDYGTVVILEDYSRTGYNFEGWYDNPQFTGTPLTEITILGDTQIFAKMSVKYVTITIRYVDNLGREFDSDSITGQEGEPYSITVPEYEGYRYRRASGALSGELSEMTITLTYDKLGTVTFRFVDENTGEDIYPSVVKEGVVGNRVSLGVFDYPRVPTGYRMTSSMTVLTSRVTVGDEPKEIIINYSDLYTLTYNVNGGEAIASETYKYNTLVELPTPVREGYRFDGWYRGYNMFSTITSVRMTSDITVNAIWVRQGTVTVRHIDEEGNEIAPTETLVGDVNSRYTTQPVEVEGYYLVSSSRNTTGRFGRNAITVTYTYSNKYTVKFENSDLEDIVVTYNDEVELEKLTKEEYVFAGWYSEPEFTNKLGDSIVITEDTTVYAYFIKISDIEVDPLEEKDEEAAEEAKEVIQEALASEELVDGIDAETKENIIAAAANGDTILVELEVTEVDPEDIPEDVDLINSEVGEKNYGYYNVSIILRASSDNSILGTVTELNKEILVTLPIPEFPELEEGMIRKYYIVRVHNGEVTILETTLNDDNTVSAYSDEFSTYAVYYEDEEEELPPDTAVNETAEFDNIVYFDDEKKRR